MTAKDIRANFFVMMTTTTLVIDTVQGRRERRAIVPTTMMSTDLFAVRIVNTTNNSTRMRDNKQLY